MAFYPNKLLALFTLLGISLFVNLTSANSAKAAELIMLEQAGCPWCDRWREEIGPIYPKTDEAKIAPLRVVDIHDKWPEDLKNINTTHYTPTFVLVENGEEVGRIRGYTGDEFFWFLLNELIVKLKNT